MGRVVTGISQDGRLKPLEDALRSAGMPLEPIQMVGPDDSAHQLTDIIERAHIDTDIMTGGGQGTSVPGLTGSGSASLSGLGTGRHAYFRDEALWDRLGDFEIPDSEMENYVEAVQAGRSVVAYFAQRDNDVQKLEEIFRGSGLNKVKTF
jgi:hypothetical protein